MKRMTYSSRFARSLSPGEIEEIGAHSSRRNKADGITGVLLTLGTVFFQIIEGDEQAVDDLYRRVLADERHTDIVCLRTESGVEDRLFPDWSMNVFDLDQARGDVVEPLKLLLGRMSETQSIIESYTQPAVSRIIRQGLNPLDLPLRNVERVVLFTDMVAFSAISERLPIEQVSELVSAYMEACTNGIVRNGGEVTKLLGDGVMAYFEGDAVDAALQSCVDIFDELERIRTAAPPRSGLGLLWSGFGLDVGPVLEGSMGSSVKMDYTIIGEAVNTAARVEALTRRSDSPVLMTAAIAERAASTWSLERVGEFDIGSANPVVVHALDVRCDVCGDAGESGGGMRVAVEQLLDTLTAD